MKKNFVVVGALAGTLIFTQSALAAGLAVTPSKNTLSVQSGEGVQTVEAVPAYLYQDNNYFMLRDLGKILGYRVDWNEAKKQASLTKESAAQDLQHLSAAKQAKAVKQSKQTILVGATEYENMNCLNIDGYNYFKLRDVAYLLRNSTAEFEVGWEKSTNVITLISNSFTSMLLNATLGTMFGGNWGEDKIFGDEGSLTALYHVDRDINADSQNFGNKIMTTLGLASVVYTLGMKDAAVFTAKKVTNSNGQVWGDLPNNGGSGWVG